MALEEWRIGWKMLVKPRPKSAPGLNNWLNFSARPHLYSARPHLYSARPQLYSARPQVHSGKAGFGTGKTPKLHTPPLAAGQVSGATGNQKSNPGLVARCFPQVSGGGPQELCVVYNCTLPECNCTLPDSKHLLFSYAACLEWQTDGWVGKIGC